MKIFTVIVTYNGEKWIKSCLSSVLNSSIPISIIIADNCSSDNTIKIIEQNFNEVVLLKQNVNLGFGKANNIGIKYALDEGADFVFLLNQDTSIDETTIEKLYKLSVENTDYGILSPTHLNGDGSALDISFMYYTRHDYCKYYTSDFVLNKPKKDIYELPMINAAAWFIPKNTFEMVGGFDPMFFLYGEDNNYCQRIKYHNLKIGVTPLTFIRHDSENNYLEEFEEGSNDYYQKFLNRIKVEYANVNSNKYKEIGKLIKHLKKQSTLELIKMNITKYNIIRKKVKLLNGVNFKDSVIQNRIIFRNHLNNK